jgi:hypothetical protein
VGKTARSLRGPVGQLSFGEGSTVCDFTRAAMGSCFLACGGASSKPRMKIGSSNVGNENYAPLGNRP